MEQINTSTNSLPNTITQYLNRIGQIQRITLEEEQILATKSQQGCLKSRNKLVETNLRFVVSLATGFAWCGNLMDIISAGNVGLMKAAKKFKPGTAAKFSTYAAHWIRREIKIHVDSVVYGKVMHVPSPMCAKIAKAHVACGSLEKVRTWSSESEKALADAQFSTRMVRQIRAAAALPLSLDGDLSHHNSTSISHDAATRTCLKEVIPDLGAPNPCQSLDCKLFKNVLQKAFTSLSKKHQTLLTMRFGLDGTPPQTLESIGTKFKLTRERVRQIERDALCILRKRVRFIDVHLATRAGMSMHEFNIYMSKNGSTLKSKKKGEPSYALQ